MSKLWMKRQKSKKSKKTTPRAPRSVAKSLETPREVEVTVNVTSGDKTCDHGLRFDEVEANGLSASEVRRRFPRLFGDCPKGCGFRGIAYVSMHHFYAGSW